MPALAYAVGETAQAATTGGLVTVGTTAAAAAVGHARAGRVRWGAGLAFSFTGVLASLLGTRVSPGALLICFATLMIIAARAMGKTMVPARPSELAEDEQATRLRTPATAGVGRGAGPTASRAAGISRTATSASRPGLSTATKVLAAGLVVGFLTGFLGVGGGFIIVPALVLSLRYQRPTAVGTSLLVISLNSGVALLARGGHQSVHRAVVVPFTLAAVAGSGVGKRVADRLSGASLTRACAVLLLAVAAYVLLRTLLVD